MTLKEYRKKRNFKKTSEPKGKKVSGSKPIFVVQKHYAKRLHFDFRIAVGNKLVSWAVPKGISKNTKDKRLAIRTEDHPMEYASFEGKIPENEYGSGKVEIWDSGTYKNIKINQSGKEASMRTCLREGHLEIELKGKKLRGSYALIHFKEENWLIIKMRSTSKKRTEG